MKKLLTAAVLVLASVALACTTQAAVDQVPIGSKVDVTQQDGVLVSGTLSDRNAQTITVATGQSVTALDRKTIADIRAVDPSKPYPGPPPKARFRAVTVPAGTRAVITLGTDVASDHNSAEDPVQAALAEPILVEGTEVVPVGSALSGVVSEAQAAGRVKGRASLALTFDHLTVGDESYSISAVVSRSGAGRARGDVEKIGIGAGIGTVIGAIAGGGKGAAIGAAVGGGGGTAVALSTPGQEVSWPSGTRLALTMDKSVDVKVPIKR